MASSTRLERILTEPKSVVLPITLRGKMVRLERLELSWDKTRQILSLQCMPIPPQPHMVVRRGNAPRSSGYKPLALLLS